MIHYENDKIPGTVPGQSTEQGSAGQEAESTDEGYVAEENGP